MAMLTCWEIMAIDQAWPFGFLLRYNEKYGGNKKRSGIFVFDVGLVLNFNISFINLKWRFVLRRDSLPPTVRPIEVCPHHTHHRWFKIAKQLTENVYQPGPTHSSNNMCLILILARSLHHKTGSIFKTIILQLGSHGIDRRAFWKR